jgi:hypothetical protein
VVLHGSKCSECGKTGARIFIDRDENPYMSLDM